MSHRIYIYPDALQCRAIASDFERLHAHARDIPIVPIRVGGGRGTGMGEKNDRHTGAGAVDAICCGGSRGVWKAKGICREGRVNWTYR